MVTELNPVAADALTWKVGANTEFTWEFWVGYTCSQLKQPLEYLTAPLILDQSTCKCRQTSVHAWASHEPLLASPLVMPSDEPICWKKECHSYMLSPARAPTAEGWRRMLTRTTPSEATRGHNAVVYRYTETQLNLRNHTDSKAHTRHMHTHTHVNTPDAPKVASAH